MNGKTHDLLKQAERQAENTTPKESSVISAGREFSSIEEATEKFRCLKEKLLRVRQWNNEAGLSSYELFNSNGDVRREEVAAAGNFIKITLPGSGKSDWVKISEIHDAPDEIVLTVKPAPNPTEKEPDENTTSHFFTSEATNNFCLRHEEKSINMYVIGLSEKSNTEETKNILETARNFATANLGRFFGIQHAQWKMFCESFIESEKG